MGLQVLVAAVGENPATLAGRMNLESDAIIVNQTDRYAYQEYKYLCPNGAKKIQCYNLAERGVGLSRNHALLRATGDFLLFADEDIVYDSGYEQKVLEQFAQHPEADFCCLIYVWGKHGRHIIQSVFIGCIYGTPDVIQRILLPFGGISCTRRILLFICGLVVVRSTATARIVYF